MTVYDETAGVVVLAVSFVAFFVPMIAIWLTAMNRRVRKREAALDGARRTAEQRLADARARIDDITAHAALSKLERDALVEMTRIVIEEGNRRFAR
jgi:hypothetical protein